MVYIVIYKYKVGETVEQYIYTIENTRQCRYWTKPPRDEDFETEEIYNLRCKESNDKQIVDALSQYSKKTLYSNATWLCIETAKETYLKIATDYGISSDSLLEVWKEGSIIDSDM
jgi:hypothetical protein